jgi:hypothetical protein
LSNAINYLRDWYDSIAAERQLQHKEDYRGRIRRSKISRDGERKGSCWVIVTV